MYKMKNPHSFNKKFKLTKELEETDIVRLMPINKTYFVSIEDSIKKQKA